MRPKFAVYTPKRDIDYPRHFLYESEYRNSNMSVFYLHLTDSKAEVSGIILLNIIRNDRSNKPGLLSLLK